MKVKNVVNKTRKNLTELGWKASLVACGLMAPINSALAGAPAPAAPTADSKWNAMISFILPWIQRLGGVVLLIGAIEFGLAFKNDDAEAKTKGMRTAIAGCIVIAIGLSSSTFLMP